MLLRIPHPVKKEEENEAISSAGDFYSKTSVETESASEQRDKLQ